MRLYANLSFLAKSSWFKIYSKRGTICVSFLLISIFFLRAPHGFITGKSSLNRASILRSICNLFWTLTHCCTFAAYCHLTTQLLTLMHTFISDWLLRCAAGPSPVTSARSHGMSIETKGKGIGGRALQYKKSNTRRGSSCGQLFANAGTKMVSVCCMNSGENRTEFRELSPFKIYCENTKPSTPFEIDLMAKLRLSSKPK